jgi:hypothetical protein
MAARDLYYKRTQKKKIFSAAKNHPLKTFGENTKKGTKKEKDAKENERKRMNKKRK